MNTSKFLTATLAVAFSTSALATDAKFDLSNADRNVYTCVAAASNDVNKLKILMKLEAYGEESIVSGLFCNDMDITAFAAKYHAYEAIDYLNKFTDSKTYVDVVALKNSNKGNNDTTYASE